MTRRQRIETMLAETPDDAELRYFLAMEFVSEGDLVRGLAELQAVNRTSPTYPAAYLQAGQLLVKLGREEEAASTYREGIEQARKIGDQHAAREMQGFLDAI